MHELAGSLDDVFVSAKTALQHEFETHLPDWTRLAFRVAFSVVRHREDAEDIAQDVLTRAHGRLGQLRDTTRLRAWLVRAAWRAAIDRRDADRRRALREQVPPDMTSPPNAEDIALTAERSARLWEAIDSLSDKLRIVVILSSIEEHDLARVAAALDIPEGTVKSRLFEARRHLKERLR